MSGVLDDTDDLDPQKLNHSRNLRGNENEQQQPFSMTAVEGCPKIPFIPVGSAAKKSSLKTPSFSLPVKIIFAVIYLQILSKIVQNVLDPDNSICGSLQFWLSSVNLVI